MCGIAGLVCLERDRARPGMAAATARTMAATLFHRGPDDEGLWASDDGTVALAHRRLAIVDLSPRGRNPMFWDDGRLAITFNGEIYNFPELRAELEQYGHRFRSKTDTEVILAAYEQWGLECLPRFAGMFAIALWDAPKRRLWVVRDRLGKKPLYYAQYGGFFRFASELKALLTDDSFPDGIDEAALRMYLRYGYIPSPLTIFKNARKLEPAHYLLCQDGQVSLTRYWDPLDFVAPPALRTDEDTEAALESLLATAVRQRQLADVPLGAFLSGGIDSSLVVALMQEQNTTPVRTFTIRFESPECNEADHAAAVARHLKTAHAEQTCGERQMLDLVGRLPGMFDEPFADSSAIPTYLVSEVARQQVTVALSGDGGDELFFGYPRYRYHADATWALGLPRSVRLAAARAAEHLPNRRLRRIADVLRNSEEDTYARFIAWYSPDDVRRIAGDAPADAPLYRDALGRSEHMTPSQRSGLLDLVSYLPDDILTKVDRTSMAASLEVRAPLLDHRVVEFALALPLRMKRRGKTMKWLLRQLLYKRVPKELIDRPKMGFGVPLRSWFLGPLREQMNDYCAGDDLEQLGLDPAPIRALWREFSLGRHHRPDLVWQAFVLVAWSRRFVTERRLVTLR
jgi:asparagine synthase (glutamine-hydrolysing)